MIWTGVHQLAIAGVLVVQARLRLVAEASGVSAARILHRVLVNAVIPGVRRLLRAFVHLWKGTGWNKAIALHPVMLNF